MKKAKKTAKPEPEIMAAKPEESEKHDTTRAGSLRRLAKAWRETSVWDNQTVAKMFEAEADLLDPPKEKKSDE